MPIKTSNESSVERRREILVAANKAFFAARRELGEAWRGRLREFEYPGERREAVLRSEEAEADVERKRAALLVAWHEWVAVYEALPREAA